MDRITEIHSKSVVSENRSIAYDSLENQLYDGNVILVKGNQMHNL